MTNPPVHLGDHGDAFARNLRAVRHAKQITLDQLVAALAARGHRLTRDQLIRIEAGQRRATVDDACQLAHVLEVKLVRLVAPGHVAIVPDRPLAGVLADPRRPGGEAL